MIKEAQFRHWLERETGLTARSRGDVISRLRRISKSIDVGMSVPDDEFYILLKQEDEVASATQTVRSQLKRTAILYRQFLGISDQ